MAFLIIYPSEGELLFLKFTWFSIARISLAELSDWRLKESGSPDERDLLFFRENAFEKELLIWKYIHHNDIMIMIQAPCNVSPIQWL